MRHEATRALGKAEQAQRLLERDAWRGQGQHIRLSASAGRYWQLAQAAFNRWSVQERAFERPRAALRPFTPEGELNSRPRAEAEAAAALAELTGPEWTRVKQRLAEPEAFTFLDRVRQRLAALPLASEMREALVQADRLRRQPEPLRGEGQRAAALRGVMLVSGVMVSLLSIPARFFQRVRSPASV